jgi:hypothetical protein
MVYGLRFMVYGLWFMDYHDGLWFMMFRVYDSGFWAQALQVKGLRPMG